MNSRLRAMHEGTTSLGPTDEMPILPQHLVSRLYRPYCPPPRSLVSSTKILGRFQDGYVTLLRSFFWEREKKVLLHMQSELLHDRQKYRQGS